MPGGRPSKYCQEIVDLAYHYIDNYQEYDDIIPTHEGMAVELGVSRDTLYTWAKDENKEFSDILAKCNAKQARLTINGSLSNNYNATIAKLLLGKHGYHEKQDVSQETKVTFEQLSDEELERIVSNQD